MSWRAKQHLPLKLFAVASRVVDQTHHGVSGFKLLHCLCATFLDVCEHGLLHDDLAASVHGRRVGLKSDLQDMICSALSSSTISMCDSETYGSVAVDNGVPDIVGWSARGDGGLSVKNFVRHLVAADGNDGLLRKGEIESSQTCFSRFFRGRSRSALTWPITLKETKGPCCSWSLCSQCQTH